MSSRLSPLDTGRWSESRELIGRTLRDALPEVQDQGYLQILDNVLATGQPYQATGAALQLRVGRNGALIERYVDLILPAHR